MLAFSHDRGGGVQPRTTTVTYGENAALRALRTYDCFAMSISLIPGYNHSLLQQGTWNESHVSIKQPLVHLEYRGWVFKIEVCEPHRISSNSHCIRYMVTSPSLETSRSCYNCSFLPFAYYDTEFLFTYMQPNLLYMYNTVTHCWRDDSANSRPPATASHTVMTDYCHHCLDVAALGVLARGILSQTEA